MIATSNLAPRFGLELAGLAALAYAGFHAVALVVVNTVLLAVLREETAMGWVR